MNMLRRMSTSRLLTLCASVTVVVVAVAAAAAGAFGGSGPVPKPESLPVAVHQALTARPVDGVAADIQFTNHLVDASSLRGASPLVTGASGRLWAARGHLRLELQGTGDGQTGDTEVLLDDRSLEIYDVASKTVYRATLAPDHATGADASKDRSEGDHGPPTVARIRRALARIDKHLSLSGPIAGDIAGRPQYSVRVAPRQDGGLLGAVELGWDAVKGVPLHASVYARGNATPVLQLAVTNIQFGPMPPSSFAIQIPAGVKVVRLGAPGGHPAQAGRQKHHPVTGLAAVRGVLPFGLAAPASLDGLPRQEVSEVDWNGSPAAVVTYGKGLGAIAVLEQRQTAKDDQTPSFGPDKRDSSLPTVSIDGASATELATPLGTVLRFGRGGVEYTLAGSVTSGAAEIAARAL